MKKNKGAISIFALLSMMFFLIFIMVAYNNVSQKAKTQVETEGVLIEYYKSPVSASDIIKSLKSGDVSSTDNADKNTKLKESELQGQASSGNKAKYIYSNGKIYKIN